MPFGKMPFGETPFGEPTFGESTGDLWYVLPRKIWQVWSYGLMALSRTVEVEDIGS
jgi:hypothetical protein